MMSELNLRQAIAMRTARALVDGDIENLERLSQLYRSARTRTPSGLWQLTLFYSGMGQAFDSASHIEPQQVDRLADVIAQWEARYPQSPAAHIAVAELWIWRAWDARGAGYAGTVQPDAWPVFRADIAKAREALERHKDVASADPQWYQDMLGIAKAEAWGRSRFDALLEEALQREPGFYQTYFAALDYPLPKWHGDIDEIDAFVQDAVKRTRQVEGQGMYARIYWYASQAQFENGLFAESRVDWPRMKAGFDDVIATWPDPWNLNNYARFACLAHDGATTRMLIERIGLDVIAEAWGSPSIYAQCDAWSKGKGASPVPPPANAVQAATWPVHPAGRV
jgi:hypothetical protein